MTSDQKIERGINRLPVKFRTMALKVYAGNAPRSQAIKLQCVQCMGGDIGEVKRCDNESCSLHKYRPFVPHPKRVGKSSKSADLGAMALPTPIDQRIDLKAFTPTERTG